MTAIDLPSCSESLTALNAQALERLADIGELAGSLAHEFADFLNLLLLHISVLELKLPPEFHADLGEISQHGNQVNALINQFHHARQEITLPVEAVELNGLLEDVDAQFRANQAEVVLEVVPCEPEAVVTVSRLGLSRLVRFLVGNAIRAASLGGHLVILRAQVDAENRSLFIEDTGPTPNNDALANLFRPSRPRCPGVEGLEMAASRSLARRLGVTLHPSIRAKGGMVCEVRFPPERL